ncbi:MAK10-like protein [Tanacetum coccineum]
MKDENLIRTLGDYSKPSHEGYRNSIELPVGNNVDPNQHLKDFLKLVDSLDIDGENRERTRLSLFQFSLRDQASNWLERLLAGSISTWKDLSTRFLSQFFPPGRTAKLRYDILIRTIDQSAGGKHRDLNPEESWAILEDLTLYDNKSWNDPRDFVKSVKAITLPQDVPSTSDRRLIVLENQVQRLMEAHLDLTQPTQNPEQAFIEYASSRTDEAGEGLVFEFMASQDARLSKFEADFKQQQSEMTNKIDTVLKAITDRIAGTLPSDTIKNPKLGTHPISYARSYQIVDPQCSSHPSNSINAIKAHIKKAAIPQTSLQQPEVETEPPQPEEPEPTLEDEFQDLHLNLPVLEVLAHALIYNAILDKYVESLKLGKNGSAFFQGETPTKMGDPGLFTLPCRLGGSKPFDTLADLGSCVNIIPLYLFKKLNIELLEETDHIFGLANRTKSYPVGIVKYVEVYIGRLKLLNDFYVIDMKKDPETPLLVGRGFLTANAVIDYRMARIAVGEGITRRMVEFLGATPINLKCNMWESDNLIEKPINWDKPLKNKDRAWHAKIRLIDPDGEEFTKTLQSIPTTRKLSERETPREIINLDHFYDT